MKTNEHPAITFLKTLYQKCQSGTINLRFKPSGKGSKAYNRFLNLNEIESIPQILSKNRNLNCWFGVALRNGNNGKKEGISLIPGPWLDHDNITDEVDRKIHELLKPTAIIQTSLPTKRQYYWVFKEPCGPEQIEKVEDINRGLANYYEGCHGSWDAAHVLRIPGTWNMKPEYGKPLPCCIVELNESVQYNPSDFDILPPITPIRLAGAREYQRSSSKDQNGRLTKIMQCEFLKHCDRDRAVLPERHWYVMVNLLCHEPGGKDLIHKLSIGYPGYSPAETDQKILHGLGTPPYTCGRIKSIWNCGRDCAVKSPAVLAYQELIIPIGQNGQPNGKRDNPLSFNETLMGGVAGAFADLYSQYVEPPKVFLYFGFLTCWGSILAGRLTLASEISPPTRFYTLCLGQSADDRKSTGISLAVELFRIFFPDSLSVCFGVGSAEGLQEKIKETPGGRVLLLYDEFRAFVSKCKIEASVLLPCVNTLFEKNEYESRTKTTDIKLENAHLSILAASTIQTFQNTWTGQFLDIGFNNRLFLVPGVGERKNPIPAKIPESEKRDLAAQIAKLLAMVGPRLEMLVDPKAMTIFQDWYLNLTPSVHAKRIDTYALRFMPLLALNEGKTEVDAEIVEKTISIMDWQLAVREQLDPIDADNEVAKMEGRIRRCLKRGPSTERDLKRDCHASRHGVWFLFTALKNLSTGRSPEIRFNGKSKTWEIVAKNVSKN